MVLIYALHWYIFYSFDPNIYLPLTAIKNRFLIYLGNVRCDLEIWTNRRVLFMIHWFLSSKTTLRSRFAICVTVTLLHSHFWDDIVGATTFLSSPTHRCQYLKKLRCAFLFSTSAHWLLELMWITSSHVQCVVVFFFS